MGTNDNQQSDEDDKEYIDDEIDTNSKWKRKDLKKMVYDENGDLMKPGLYRFETADVYDDPSYKNVSEQMGASLIANDKGKQETSIFNSCCSMFWSNDDLDGDL